MMPSTASETADVSRFEPIDTRFFVPRTPVSIVDYGATAEAFLARAMLESMGAVTLLHQPTPADFLLILGEETNVPPYLILCGHGDEVGFVFEEYGEGIDTSSLVDTSMPPEAVVSRVRLPGCVVLATGCLTGRGAMGQAFLRGDVRASIAPDGYPAGNDVPMFLTHFFHRLLVRRATGGGVGARRGVRGGEPHVPALYGRGRSPPRAVNRAAAAGSPPRHERG